MSTVVLGHSETAAAGSPIERGNNVSVGNVVAGVSIKDWHSRAGLTRPRLDVGQDRNQGFPSEFSRQTWLTPRGANPFVRSTSGGQGAGLTPGPLPSSRRTAALSCRGHRFTCIPLWLPPRFAAALTEVPRVRDWRFPRSWHLKCGGSQEMRRLVPSRWQRVRGDKRKDSWDGSRVRPAGAAAARAGGAER